jgi:hypothetical protein
MKNFLLKFIVLLILVIPVASYGQQLRISKNQKFIEKSDGTPFLWLGDTAWELFHKLNREDASYYLKNRADKGFTIIQAVVLAELDGLGTPNAYGELPLMERDPARPNEKYFEHVDFIVAEAEKLGLFIGMLPTWGDKVTTAHGGNVIFNENNARIYGEFLGNRYKESPIVWILGGDRDIANESEKLVWRAMAEGIKKGDNGNHLMTYHPRGASSSHTDLHHEEWLDFNMYQSGHAKRFTEVYRFAETLLKVEPRKPFVEGEPAYEDIPIAFWEFLDFRGPVRVPAEVLNDDSTIKNKDHFNKGFFNDYDMRVHGYWNLLSGACGYTYGHNAVWQMFERGKSFAIPCLTDWREALDRPGAKHMKYLSKLFEAYPVSDFEPAQNIIVNDNPQDKNHIRAALAKNKSFLLAYLAVGQLVQIDASNLNKSFRGYWYNPRKGEFSGIGKFKNKGLRTFSSPTANEDWLLVLDVSKRN